MGKRWKDVSKKGDLYYYKNLTFDDEVIFSLNIFCWNKMECSFRLYIYNFAFFVLASNIF